MSPSSSASAQTPAIAPVEISTLTAPTAGADARWFREEIHRHDGQLRAYLRSAYPSVRDVEDVVQESYLRVWRRQAIRPIASAKNFLFSIARHLAVDFLRRERVCSVMPVADLSELAIRDEKPGVAETASANEELSLLLEAIDRLPHRCREIMIRRKLQGESQRQIAQSLGISELTVQTQVARGTRRCEEFMREKGLVADTEP